MAAEIAVSSWALHHTLGVSYPHSPGVGREDPKTHGASSMPLLELPALLAEQGFRTLQLCHFHLPSRTADYILDFRDAMAEAGVRLHALLIDDGDITDPDNGERDAAWIASWLKTAEALGAENARVIAGKQPWTNKSRDVSVRRLLKLTGGTEVRILIENWYDLLATPEAVTEILDALEGDVGFCADFGNWPRATKYRDLPEIMPDAEVCHAKFDFVDDQTLDEEDAAKMMAICEEADFLGPYVLVNGGSGADEWEALRIQAERIRLG